MKARLAALLRSYPLGTAWATPSLFQEDFALGDFRVRLLGMECKREGGHAVTASAGEPRRWPLVRCYFELIERASVAALESGPARTLDVVDAAGETCGEIRSDQLFPADDASGRWRHSRSNGVAAHRDAALARASAERELIERDRVLRAWFGAIRPREMTLTPGLVPVGLGEHYDFAAYAFDDSGGTIRGASVTGLFGFPRSASAPLVFGFSARATPAESLAAAARECFQRVGFLWGCELPSEPPAFSPTPEYHQERFLHADGPKRIEAWLKGAHFSEAYRREAGTASPQDMRFVDITPTGLRGKAFVVKALSKTLWPLTFGLPKSKGLPAHLAEELLVHPIA